MVVNIGAIGLGNLGQIQLDLCAEREDVVIVCGSDIVSDARESFDEDFDGVSYEAYNDMLEEHGETLDAVFIVSPHTLHYEHAKACLKRDINIHLEKPMTTDIDQAQELIDIADSRDLVLQIGYQRHFHPGFIELKKIITSGWIGEVHTANCYMGQRWISDWHDTWRANPDLSGGGQLYDSGSHLVDTLLWTTGGKPHAVFATLDRYDDQYETEVDVNSAITAILDGPDRRITASIGITGDGKGPSPEEGFQIWGTEGRVSYEEPTITIDEYDGQTYTAEITDDLSFVPLTRKKINAFFDSIINDSEVVVDGEFGLQVTAFTEAAYEAAESEQLVYVQDVIEATNSGAAGEQPTESET